MKAARDMGGMGRYGTVGLEMVISILFGLFIGIKLDEWLHTKPYLSVVWFGFGCAAAGRAVYRAWKGMQAEAKREEAEQGNPAQAFPDEKSLEWDRKERKERKIREAIARGEPAESALENDENGAMKASPEEEAEKRDG